MNSRENTCKYSKEALVISRKNNYRYTLPFVHFSQYLLGATLLLLLGAAPLMAQNAPETVIIKLPDGSDMRFQAVYLGIKKDKENHFPSLFASRRFQLGSYDSSKNSSFEQQKVSLELSGAFIGRRNEQPDWLYYLGETEVSRGQWNSIMRWMDKQEGKPPAIKLDDSQAKLPQNQITVAQVYRFIEALNKWILQEQKENLPKLGQAYAFCRLPTEAEWAFAARGGIKVLEENPDKFDRPYPYDELNKYEWNSDNSGVNPRECGSTKFANPIGLRDMLGNVEELTMSLFSPLYVHGRLGQFVTRGNSFRDSGQKFDVSSRTEFNAYKDNGELNLSDRVGFRLTLSSSISGSGATKALDEECQKYMKDMESAEPSLVTSTPALQAEQNSNEYAEKQLNIFKADLKEKNHEISRLKDLRNKDQAVLTEKEQDNIELRDSKERLEAQVAALQKQLRLAQDNLRDEQEKAKKLADIENADLTTTDVSCEADSNNLRQQVKDLKQQIAVAPSPEELEKYKQNISQLQDKNKALADDLANLKLSEKKVQERFLVSTDNYDKRELELKQKDQRISDLERRQEEREDKIAENAKFAQTAEKRYLEALMRQSYTNAYNAYAQLVKRQEIYLPRGDNNKATEAYSQACQMIHDYWTLVVKIAEETQADLFPEVKKKVADWLQDGERKNLFNEECRTADGQQLLSPIQRKSLNLIERHVKLVRDVNSRFPDDLIDTFMNQPEFK